VDGKVQEERLSDEFLLKEACVHALLPVQRGNRDLLPESTYHGRDSRWAPILSRLSPTPSRSKGFRSTPLEPQIYYCRYHISLQDRLQPVDQSDMGARTSVMVTLGTDILVLSVVPVVSYRSTLFAAFFYSTKSRDLPQNDARVNKIIRD